MHTLKKIILFLFLYINFNIYGENEESLFNINSINNNKIKVMCESIKEPSLNSIVIQDNILGNWTLTPNLSTYLPNVSLISVCFNNEGVMEYKYKINKKNEIKIKKLLYQFIHKGKKKNYGGKLPNIVLKSSVSDSEQVMILTNVNVDYDNRLPLEIGKVLKFNDIEGNIYVLIKEKKNVDIKQIPVNTNNSSINIIHNKKTATTRDKKKTQMILYKMKKEKLNEYQLNKTILQLSNEGDNSCVPILIDYLSETYPFTIRQNAIKALGNIGDNKAVIPLLEIILKKIKGKINNDEEKESVIRRSVINALEKLDFSEKNAIFDQILKTENEYDSVKELIKIKLNRFPLKSK